MPAGRYWSSSEQKKAIELRARGLSYGQIALRLDRTGNAVAARLRYLKTAENAPKTRDPKPPEPVQALSAFERQMAALKRGVGLVPVFRPSRSYDFTLGGVSPL